MCSYISPYWLHAFVYYQWNSILCFTDFVAKLWHFLAFHRLYTKPFSAHIHYSKAAKSLGTVLLFMCHEINESPWISLTSLQVYYCCPYGVKEEGRYDFVVTFSENLFSPGSLWKYFTLSRGRSGGKNKKKKLK